MISFPFPRSRNLASVHGSFHTLPTAFAAPSPSLRQVGCVGKAIRNKYKKGGAQNAQLLMPHVYHLVDQTYAQMMMEQKSQSILISGAWGMEMPAQGCTHGARGARG